MVGVGDEVSLALRIAERPRKSGEAVQGPLDQLILLLLFHCLLASVACLGLGREKSRNGRCQSKEKESNENYNMKSDIRI